MSGPGAARDAIQGMVAAGFAGNVLTSSMPLQWDDVRGDAPGHDAHGLPISWARSTVRHTVASTQSIGPAGTGRELIEGTVVVQIFTPKGDGYKSADAIAAVVVAIFQRQTIPGLNGGHFFGTIANEVPATGPWNQINVSASFRYSEVPS